MNNIAPNLDAISSEKILSLGEEHLHHKNYNVALKCFSILSTRNPFDFYFRFHHANLLRFQTDINNSQAINESKKALIKILSDFPEVFDNPKDFSLFFLKLAEISYDTDQMKDARVAYSMVITYLQDPAYIFRYIELLAMENIQDPRITPMLQNVINIDPSKFKIKNELFKIVIENKGNLTSEKIKEIASMGFKFSNGWFLNNGNPSRWEKFILKENPRKILEIGSYEGQSVCFLIEKLSDGTNLEIHALDNWEGGIEHQAEGVDMSVVEQNFDYNVKLASKNKSNIKIYKHKGFSDTLMPKMLASGMKNYFDLVYIDGSHEAPDVLSDAIMGFRLLKIGGIMAFDDYLPPMNNHPLETAKPAIDSFTNVYFRKIEILRDDDNYQLLIRKRSD